MAPEVSKLMVSHMHSLSIGDRFFSTFLRDNFPSKYESSKHKGNVEKGQSAHRGVPKYSDEALPKDPSEAFENFIRATEDGDFHKESLRENKQPETRHYWDFMKKYSSFIVRLNTSI